MQKFVVGDKFVFDIELMKENNITLDAVDNEIHEVCSVEFYEGLGEIVGWWGNNVIPSQCNAVWLKRHLTKRAGDEGDSPASEHLSNPKVGRVEQALSTPAPRQ